MAFNRSTDYKLWIFIVAIVFLIFGAAAGGYYFFTANRQYTASVDLDSTILPNELYQIIHVVDRELVLIEGTITDIALEQTENLTYPDQHFVSIRIQNVPHAIFKISLGPPQRPLRIYYPQKESIPDTVIGQTVPVSQLVDLLTPGNRVGVELSFPLNQPEIKASFMTELNQFSSAVAGSNDRQTFPVHYFRTHRVNIYE